MTCVKRNVPKKGIQLRRFSSHYPRGTSRNTENIWQKLFILGIGKTQKSNRTLTD